MANFPPGLGKTIEFEAVRPLDSYSDPGTNRLRLGTALADGSVVYLWLKAEHIRPSLDLLRAATKQFGIPWPKPLDEP